MGVVNIIAGALLVVASIAIILVVLFTNTDNSGINSAIGGGSNSFYGRNGGKTGEAKLQLATKIAVGVLFVVAVAATIIAKFAGTGV